MPMRHEHFYGAHSGLCLECGEPEPWSFVDILIVSVFITVIGGTFLGIFICP